MLDVEKATKIRVARLTPAEEIILLKLYNKYGPNYRKLAIGRWWERVSTVFAVEDAIGREHGGLKRAALKIVELFKAVEEDDKSSTTNASYLDKKKT